MRFQIQLTAAVLFSTSSIQNPAQYFPLSNSIIKKCFLDTSLFFLLPHSLTKTRPPRHIRSGARTSTSTTRSLHTHGRCRRTLHHRILSTTRRFRRTCRTSHTHHTLYHQTTPARRHSPTATHPFRRLLHHSRFLFRVGSCKLRRDMVVQP